MLHQSQASRRPAAAAVVHPGPNQYDRLVAMTMLALAATIALVTLLATIGPVPASLGAGSPDAAPPTVLAQFD